jgi:adenine-specific DNA-methyltransferase
MTKLTWENKSPNPFRTALPFQTVEIINESSEQRVKNLFQTETDWRNKLIWGDKKYVLPSLLPMFAGKVNLIYIDPPFDTGANFSFTAEVGEGEEFTKQPNAIELKAYNDTWGKGLDTYLQWFYDTALLLRELLSGDGSIYVHLDWHVGHYAKCVLDEVFGYENFRNEIIVKRVKKNVRERERVKSLNVASDIILFYAKSESVTILPPTKPEYKDARWHSFEASGFRNGMDYELFGKKPSKSNHWRWTREKAEDAVKEGRLRANPKSGTPEYLIDASEESLCDSLWDDLQAYTFKYDYPTEKNEALLERVIKASSNEGDLVLDCFCGSGTTAAVAEKLGRRWITCDLGRFAIHTARKRLLQIPEVKPFEVLNLGKYERQVWASGATSAAGDAYQAYLNFIMELYGGERLTQPIWIHGRKKGRLVHIGSIDSPVSMSDVRSAVSEFKELIGSGENAPDKAELDILGWDFAFEVNEMAVKMAEEMGVRVRPFKIPLEVMDSKAREQGDIKFFELAALDVKVSKKKWTVTLELNNFMLPLSDVPDEVQRSVREWSDWIDYWAVDWNYQGDAFHNESQRYRTKKERKLERRIEHVYAEAGAYQVLIKVIDILGNDTTKLLKVEVK